MPHIIKTVIYLKLFITLTKKSIAAILFAAVIAVVVLSRICSVKAQSQDGSTNAKRVEYINSIGYSVDDTPTVKEITVPQDFSPVYERYNRIQSEAGFDLSAHRGEKALVYGYKTADGEKTVTLIVSDGEIIGGDICSVRIDGEMLPLLKKEK